MPDLSKNDHAPLNVTEEAKRRVFVGLGWDPNTKTSMMDEAKALLGGKPIQHDLDLSCYVYDADKRLIERVSGEPDMIADKTGQIYHSGDNVEGLGDGDDEQISVELKDLDAGIQHIVFVATSKSGHSFGEIAAPEIRLGDGYSAHVLHNQSLSVEAGKDKACYLFVRLYRGDEGWTIHNIDQFEDLKDMDDISTIVKTYID